MQIGIVSLPLADHKVGRWETNILARSAILPGPCGYRCVCLKGSAPVLPTRLSRKGLDIVYERWTVKIDRPEAVRHNRPLAIDHIGGWRTAYPELSGHFHPRVYWGGKGIAMLPEKGLHRWCSAMTSLPGYPAVSSAWRQAGCLAARPALDPRYHL
jgi:hypothetical protein